ncbi:hypothetical protein E2C01_020039 [Portunus trituberculatus]|uniref:Uncharacterized protein n=1 Tax=Portunus trituberculatus TaxID=210409 RepID=A0A5B7DZH6_PORTR|nr:hypothetical protein [Portunus trituberculatus]
MSFPSPRTASKGHPRAQHAVTQARYFVVRRQSHRAFNDGDKDRVTTKDDVAFSSLYADEWGQR